jgi:hypothetical protein
VIARSKALLLLLAVAILIAIVALFLPPIPQPLTYHNFADHRAWLGIPNFGDVVSNLAFAIVGVWGLLVLFTPNAAKFADRRERYLYLAMFAGLTSRLSALRITISPREMRASSGIVFPSCSSS